MEQKQEQVLVTKNKPSIHYSTGDYFHLQPDGNDAWIDEVSSTFNFVDRWMAEQDSTILQLIPYVVMLSPDKKIFSYQRRGGGEQRLEGKMSIGIGGHINPVDKRKPRGQDISADAIGWATVRQGAIREVIEEVELDATLVREGLKMVGTLYTPNEGTNTLQAGPTVGQVHLGVVYVLQIEDIGIKVREIDNLINYKFLTKPADLLRYERWSQLVWQNIDAIKGSL